MLELSILWNAEHGQGCKIRPVRADQSEQAGLFRRGGFQRQGVEVFSKRVTTDEKRCFFGTLKHVNILHQHIGKDLEHNT